MGLYDFTVYDIMKRNAAIHSDSVALISGDERLTHRQFLEKVDRLACGLADTGLQKGDRVAVLAQNSVEYMYLYGACAKMGTVMLLINWRLTPNEIDLVIEDGSPRVMFVGADFQEMAAPLVSKSNSIERAHSMGPAAGDFQAFNDLMENRGNGPDVDVGSGDAYAIIPTAAIAAKPKGAVLSHGNITAANLQFIAAWQLTAKDCTLAMLPLFHIAGMGFSLAVMQAGGTNVILTRFDPDQALKHIEEDKVTMFAEFPPMLSTMLDRNKELNRDLSSLRIAGGMEAPDMVKRFEEETGAVFWTAFGQSETTGLVTLAPYFERPGSAGLPCLMSDVKIVDDHGNFVETGKTGEIVVRGPLVFKGYWNLEQETEYTLRDGWHHTGDKGRLDEEGYLFYAGRMPEKELIKPGGENVYPAEVEKVILEHPKVDEVSVIGVPDAQWGEAIKAICVLKSGESLPETELIEFVASKIARFKKPKHVVFVSDLPKTGDGSTNRDEVKAKYGAG
jgi:acyl-CoA synthetase (AMP-forming)/AMP-acid ligase II